MHIHRGGKTTNWFVKTQFVHYNIIGCITEPHSVYALNPICAEEGGQI